MTSLSKNYFLPVLACVVFFYLAFACSVSFADDGFVKHNREVGRLFKKDPEVSSLREWDKQARGLRDFLDNNPNSKLRAEAFFLLGQIYEITFIKRDLLSRLSLALEAYEELARSHPGHKLADDALLKLGDLRRFYLKRWR